jgi:mannose-1-phosphate guanylyltransferase
MVLAAGLGTRLRPLSDLRAKPLVPVGDRPALGHVLERLREAGVVRVVVNAHHRAQDVRAFVEAQPGEVAVSEEPDLLGTAGGLAQARDLLGEGDVVVWNADILATVDARALAAAHAREAPAATLVVQPMARGSGSVGLDAGGRVVRLRQERFGDETSGGEFLGIHVLGAALRGLLPPRGGLIEHVYVPALARGAVLRARRAARAAAPRSLARHRDGGRLPGGEPRVARRTGPRELVWPGRACLRAGDAGAVRRRRRGDRRGDGGAHGMRRLAGRTRDGAARGSGGYVVTS